MDEHREAVNYDLIRVGYTVEDIGGALSWGALNDFIKKSGPESALVSEIYPEQAKWASIVKTNEILADLYDLIAYLRSELVYGLSGKKSKKPVLYKRPGREDDKKRHIGRNALPVSELEEWIADRLKGGG